MANIIYTILIVIPVIYFLLRDYKKGLCISVMLLVLLPDQLVIVTGGLFPDFPIHRILLIVIITIWFFKYRSQYRMSGIPLAAIFILIALTGFMSIVISVDFVSSLKSYLSFTIEIIMFYFILITSMQTSEDVIRILNYVALGIGLVALIGFVEYYTRFNPVDSFLSGYVRIAKTARDVLSTYPHRILLGTAMAMGWPVALVLTKFQGQNRFRIGLLLAGTLMMLAVAYFTDSRGAWLGAFLSGFVFFLLSSLKIKKNLIFVALAAIAVLFIRPGVWEQISDRFFATRNVESFRGGTYQYRWALWEIAYEQIEKSPERLLLGYGPGTSASIPIEAYIEYSDREVLLWSWDNHYAAHLLEAGMIGLFLFLLLYFVVFKKLYFIWRHIIPPYKNLIAGLIASVFVIIFMMSNVRIFAPQLNFLTWALVASAITLMEYQIRMQFMQAEPVEQHDTGISTTV